MRVRQAGDLRAAEHPARVMVQLERLPPEHATAAVRARFAVVERGHLVPLIHLMRVAEAALRGGAAVPLTVAHGDKHAYAGTVGMSPAEGRVSSSRSPPCRRLRRSRGCPE